jgi:hypothetical protein
MSEDGRFVLAALAGILVPAVLGTLILAIHDGVGLVAGQSLVLFLGCVIAFFHLFFLGLPLWLAISRFTPIRLWGAGLLGAGVGLVPIGALYLLTDGWQGTAYTWGDTLDAFLFCAVTGASSGLAIRAILPIRSAEEALG